MPLAVATITSSAKSTNRACSTTPIVSHNSLEARLTLIGSWQRSSITKLPLSVTKVLPLAALRIRVWHREREGNFAMTSVVYLWQNGRTSTEMGYCGPVCSHSFDSSTTTTNFLAALAMIFSRKCVPCVPPFTKFKKRSTESAPSIVTSRFGWLSRVAQESPNESACCWVIFDAGITTISFSWPLLTFSPNLSVANANVDPVPSPTTMPLCT
mmetsp:Transcript_115640/g.181938  ORF Transcript_115640/g.181938 Transcript_115640/m.181938 type:complete len:212 (+) Transcript_115640:209-844(+)